MRELTNQSFLAKKTEINKEISINRSLFNFTTDGWSSIRVHPYIALTCHFKDNNWKMKTYLLDFRDFPHPHDSYNISETLLEERNLYLIFYETIKTKKTHFKILKDYNLSAKTLSLASDSAANMVGSVELLRNNDCL